MSTSREARAGSPQPRPLHGSQQPQEVRWRFGGTTEIMNEIIARNLGL
jgi:hypothetical protein